MSLKNIYKQYSEKISYSNYQELVEQINNLKASSKFPIDIELTTPEWTDTNDWCLVNY
ncbi:hypothetical protein K9L16_04195 [Candidatus Pacearchaeota archaeon]|nr:hypothetical protein [Candidatus Pacearchaeota archaeon]